MGVEPVPLSEVTVEQVARLLDHSILRPEFDMAAVDEACDVAARYVVASLCCRPGDVARAAPRLRGTGVPVCTVIGFPHGAHITHTKVFEAEQAMADGAVELDMVINIGRLRSGDDGYVRDDIAAVVAAATGGGATVKVIIETAYLTDDEKVRACRLAENAGAHYVKTSTGFASAGATIDDLVLMRQTVSPTVKLKASGGIRTLDAVLEMMRVPIDRCGTSSTEAILTELENRKR